MKLYFYRFLIFVGAGGAGDRGQGEGVEVSKNCLKNMLMSLLTVPNVMSCSFSLFLSFQIKQVCVGYVVVFGL